MVERSGVLKKEEERKPEEPVLQQLREAREKRVIVPVAQASEMRNRVLQKLFQGAYEEMRNAAVRNHPEVQRAMEGSTLGLFFDSKVKPKSGEA